MTSNKIQASVDFLPMPTKPSFEAIPHVLKILPRWVPFWLVPAEPKPTKVPMRQLPNGKLVPGNAHEPKNWLTFEAAISLYNRGLCSGIGFDLVERDALDCVDVDNCFNADGSLTDEAKEVIALCSNSWTEISQSGNGIHVWFYDEDFSGGRKKGNIEVYASVHYMVVTGNHVEETADEIKTVNGACKAVISEFRGEEGGNLFAETARADDKDAVIQESEKPLTVDEKDFIEYLSSNECQNKDPIIYALFSGDTQTYYEKKEIAADPSSADMSLMVRILHYVGAEGTDTEIKGRALKIFNESELAKRDKCIERDDYLFRTVTAAFKLWNNGKRRLKNFRGSAQIDSIEEKIAWIRELCDWKVNRNGERLYILCTFNSLSTIFENDPNVKDLVGYDEFHDVTVLLKDSVWGKKKSADWDDEDDAQLRLYLRQNYAELRGANDIRDMLISVAQKNTFNPVKQYFEALPAWDGTQRASEIFIKFLGVEDSPFTREVTRLWLLAAVARVYNPGCRFQFALVLHGAQGIGKSFIIEKLAGNWYVDLLDEVDDSHAIDALKRAFIVEMKELSPARKADINKVKAFIERGAETRREAYARRAKTIPRHCVFAITVNDSAFLRDQTGNRRFWILHCSNPMFKFTEGLTEEYLAQVWAEVFAEYKELFKDGFDEKKLCLKHEFQVQAEQLAALYLQDDGMTDEIVGFLNRTIPPACIWQELTKEERRKFFTQTNICIANAPEIFVKRRQSRGGKKENIDEDITAIKAFFERADKPDIQEESVPATSFNPSRTNYYIFGSVPREHICAAEVFNECFGGNDKRKSMKRIYEILDKLGWEPLGRQRNLDSVYPDQKKCYFRKKKIITVAD